MSSVNVMMDIAKELINKNVSVISMSGAKCQGKLISADSDRGLLTIQWSFLKKDNEDTNFFFRTDLRADRIESITEKINKKPETD